MYFDMIGLFSLCFGILESINQFVAGYYYPNISSLWEQDDITVKK